MYSRPFGPIVQAAVLAPTVLGTAGLLLASPASGPDTTFPLLVLSIAGLAAVVAVARARSVPSMPSLFAAGTGLLLLAVARPLHGSHDVWSYTMYGRVLAHHHRNPYVSRPLDFPGDPVLTHVDRAWRASRSVYGPGFTLLSALIVTFTAGSALAARVAFQALAAAAALAVSAVLVRSGAPRWVVAAVLLNPLLVVSVVNGGHNDLLVGLGVLLATLSVQRGRPAAAGGWFAAAALVKVVALLPAGAAVSWTWRHHGRRPAWCLGATAAAPLALGWALFGGDAVVRPLLAASHTESRASIWRPLAEEGSRSFAVQHLGLVTGIAVVGVAVLLAARGVTDGSPAPTVTAGVGAYLLAAGYVLPWYFAWALPVAALDSFKRTARIVLAQSALLLVAYDYRVEPRPDGLDRLLHVTTAAVQAVAVAAVVAAAVGIAQDRRFWSRNRVVSRRAT